MGENFKNGCLPLINGAFMSKLLQNSKLFFLKPVLECRLQFGVRFYYFFKCFMSLTTIIQNAFYIFVGCRKMESDDHEL